MKNVIKNKKILFIILGVAIVSVLLILAIVLLNKNKLTELEKVKIDEASFKVENYLDEILLHNEDEGKYINFAIEYLYNETDKESYSIEDILNIINDTFDKDYKEEDIIKVGITSEMVAKGIVFDSATKEFKYNAQKTNADIAATPIIKYQINKIKKKNKNKFEVKYDKYVVENPYEILNYYNNRNIEKAGEEKLYDTTDIVSYLKGATKIGVIKKIINKDNISEFGKIEDGSTVIYILKDGKLVIDEIK